MRKKKTVDAKELALDALMAAACHTGELDPVTTAVQSEELEALARSLSSRDAARFKHRLKDPVRTIRGSIIVKGDRTLNWEPAYPVGETLFAAGFQGRGSVRETDKLRRARSRMRRFLGE